MMDQNMSNVDTVEYDDVSIVTEEEVKIEHPPVPVDEINKKQTFTSRQIKRELDRVRKEKKKKRTVCIVLLALLALIVLAVIFVFYSYPDLVGQSSSAPSFLKFMSIIFPFRYLAKAFGSLFSKMDSLTWIGLFK